MSCVFGARGAREFLLYSNHVVGRLCNKVNSLEFTPRGIVLYCKGKFALQVNTDRKHAPWRGGRWQMHQTPCEALLK